SISIGDARQRVKFLVNNTSRAIFAKEAGAGAGGDGQVWPGEQHVGWARGVLCDQRHCASAPRIRLGAETLKHVVVPAADHADGSVVLVVTRGITLAGSCPIPAGK